MAKAIAAVWGLDMRWDRVCVCLLGIVINLIGKRRGLGRKVSLIDATFIDVSKSNLKHRTKY